MKHYNRQEWLLYKQGMCSDEKAAQMDEHLKQCNSCLDLFLSLISEAEIDAAEQSISVNFTDRVMKTIKQEHKVLSRQRNAIRSKPKNMFTYYVAASIVTIMLMGSGFFQILVDKAPGVAVAAVEAEELQESSFIMNWPDKVVEKTANFINHFEIQDKGRYKGEQKK